LSKTLYVSKEWIETESTSMVGREERCGREGWQRGRNTLLGAMDMFLILTVVIMLWL
jgi:hypothetical protein